MNKYQKALNALRKNFLNEHSPECDVLQELVDKSTPKKPIPLFTYGVLALSLSCL